jgi:hypothetical protein
VPFKRKVTGAIAALGALMLVAGCGGPQNPLTHDQLPGHLSGTFWDGFVDGFTAVFVLLLRVTGNDYQLFATGASSAYRDGFVIGILVFIGLMVSIWRRWT